MVIDPSSEMLLKTVIEEGNIILDSVFTKNALAEARLIVADYFDCSVAQIRLDCGNKKVSIDEYNDLIKRFVRRSQREPLQYISEYAYFYGEKFTVGEGVLIPRSDTEVLVEEALRIANLYFINNSSGGKNSKEIDKKMNILDDSSQYKDSINCVNKYISNNTNNSNCNNNNNSNRGFRFLEFCTGSGCISISFINQMKNKGFDTVGIATDISDAAIKYAIINKDRILSDNSLTIIKHDILNDSIDVFIQNSASFLDSEFKDIAKSNESNKLNSVDSESSKLKFIDSEISGYNFKINSDCVDGFDLIISNPPYIKTSIINDLQPEVSKYEPFLALDGGVCGLVFYRKICEHAGKLLRQGGWVVLEIGYDQEDLVRKIFETAKIYNNIKVIKDYSKNPRVIIAQKF